MQSPLFEPSSLPSLPEPSFFEQWVLQSPLLLSVIILAIGFFTYMLLRNSKHSKKIGIPSLGIAAAIAGGLFALGTLITTDREQLQTRSEELVTAAANADQAALSQLLDERAAIKTAFGSANSKDQIISLVSSRAAPTIQSATVREIRVGIYGDQVARTQIKVRVAGEMLPSNSWWQVDWTRPNTETEKWIVTDIEPLWIQGMTNPAGTR